MRITGWHFILFFKIKPELLFLLFLFIFILEGKRICEAGREAATDERQRQREQAGRGVGGQREREREYPSRLPTVGEEPDMGPNSHTMRS